MSIRRPQPYRLAIVSFLFGIMVVASVGATATLVWAETGASAIIGMDGTTSGLPYAGTTAVFVPGACGGSTFTCQADNDSLGIIPQCKVVDSGGNTLTGSDPMQCCNYTLDAFIKLAINIAMFILGISGSVALLMMVIGGFQYLTSAGEKAKVKAGTTTMVNAVIGLLIIFSSWMIVNFIMGQLVAKGTNDLTTRLGTVFNGSNKWSYQAAICTPLHFGEIGKADTLPKVLEPGVSTSAGALVAQTSQKAENKTWDECKKFCEVKNLADNSSKTGGPYVEKFGSVQRASSDKSVTDSQVRNKASQACLCRDYTYIKTSVTANQTDCGERDQMGNQSWFGASCTMPTWLTKTNNTTASASIIVPLTTGTVANVSDILANNWDESHYRCARKGTGGGETIKPFDPITSDAPSCQPMGYCCADTYKLTTDTTEHFNRATGIMETKTETIWNIDPASSIQHFSLTGGSFMTTYDNCRKLTSANTTPKYSEPIYNVHFCTTGCGFNDCFSKIPIKENGKTVLEAPIH